MGILRCDQNGDYAGACLPFGLLRSVGGPHPVQIIQDDKYIAMLYEQNSWFHVTPIDGRPHPKDPSRPGSATRSATGRATRW